MKLLMQMAIQILINQEMILRHLADEATHRGDNHSAELTRAYIKHSLNFKLTRWMREIDKR